MAPMRDEEVIPQIHRGIVLRTMLTHPNERWTSKEIKKRLSFSIQTVAAALRQLRKDGFVSKIRSQYQYEMTPKYFNEWKLTEKAISMFKKSVGETKERT